MEEMNDTAIEPGADSAAEPAAEPPLEPSPPEPSTAPAEPPPGKPQPSRFQRFLRKALLWITFMAIFFLAGVVALQVLRLRPTESRLEIVESQLEQANQKLSQLESFEAENQILLEELETTTAHLELLQVLVDVNTARLALITGDQETAEKALEGTDKHLETILLQIASFDSTLAETLPQRLNLIKSNILTDPDTAAVDFDLLMKDLLKVETALFSEE